MQCATHSQRVATLGTYGTKKFSECKLFLYVRKTFHFFREGCQHKSQAGEMAPTLDAQRTMSLSVDGTGALSQLERQQRMRLGQPVYRSCLDSKCAIRCPEDERMRMSRESALNLTLAGCGSRRC